MDAQRNFILKKGTKLRCLSLNNDISNPMVNLYFTSAEEALLSLYKAQYNPYYILSIGRDPEEDLLDFIYINNQYDLYINTFVLNEDIVINPGLVGQTNLRSVINTPVSLEDVRKTIQQDCQSLQGSDGYVVPFDVAIEQGYDVDRPQYVMGKLTAYIICKSDLLFHLASFKIDSIAFQQMINNIIAGWYYNLEGRNRPNLTTAMIIAFLTDRREEFDVVLKRELTQPSTPGLVTASEEYIRRTDLQSPSHSPSKTNPGYDPFLNVAPDVLRIMGLNMPLKDLLNFCRTSSIFNRQLCQNDVFWHEKVRLDLGQLIEEQKPRELSWKDYYYIQKRLIEFSSPSYAFNLFDPLIRQLHDDEDPRYVEPIQDYIFEQIVNIALIKRELPLEVLRREYDLVKVDQRWQNNPIPHDRLIEIFNWNYLSPQFIYYLRRLHEYDPQLAQAVRELELSITRRRIVARNNFRRGRLDFGDDAPEEQNPDQQNIPDYRGEIDDNLDINGQIREEIQQEQIEDGDQDLF
jgi:hypothetical protein